MRHYSSADETIRGIAGDLLAYGHDAAPRGMRTVEVVPYSFVLTKPRARRITIPERRWNEALAVGELCWHLAGSNDLDAIAYYAEAWRKFSDDGHTIRGSCYGRKIFGGAPGKSQWDRVRRELSHDRDSRRALLTIGNTHEDLRGPSRDVPCLTALQFLVRDGALHAVAFMRSNDLIWGLSYDLYLLTVLQELMATELGVALGSYTHVAASMHFYERHLDMVRGIASSPQLASGPPMSALDHPEEKDEFLYLERALREGRPGKTRVLSRFWSELAVPLQQLSEKRRLGIHEPASETVPA